MKKSFNVTYLFSTLLAPPFNASTIALPKMLRLKKARIKYLHIKIFNYLPLIHMALFLGRAEVGLQVMNVSSLI